MQTTWERSNSEGQLTEFPGVESLNTVQGSCNLASQAEPPAQAGIMQPQVDLQACNARWLNSTP
jgi:hypothetical protein